MAIIKIIDGGTYRTLLIKLKFTHNEAILDIKNTGKDTMILRQEEMIGIIDIGSLGYYKIKQGMLQQNLKQIFYPSRGGRCRSENHIYAGFTHI